MKKSWIIFSFLLILFFSPSVFAQQEKNQLWYTIINKVKPEKIDEFKGLMKKLASACEEHNYPFTYSTWQSSYRDFYFFWPVKDHNEAKDLMKKAWRDVIPNMEQDWAATYWASIDGWEDYFLESIDDLSYTPETSVEGLVYAEWWIHYYQPGTQNTYTNAFKKAIEMDNKGDFEYPIMRLQSDIGMNGPAIITVFWGKNHTDLYAHKRKHMEILGDERREMFKDFKSTARKFEKISFWYQKELSYSPE